MIPTGSPKDDGLPFADQSPTGSPKKRSLKNFDKIPDEILVKIAKKIINPKQYMLTNLKNLDSFAKTSRRHYNIAYDRYTLNHFINLIPDVDRKDFWLATKRPYGITSLLTVDHFLLRRFLMKKKQFPTFTLEKFFKSMRRFTNEALVNACMAGNDELIKVLLLYHADPNTQKGMPLRSATYSSHIHLIKLLLKFGADPNNPTIENPIIIAAKRNRWDIVKIFIEKGADFHINDEKVLYLAVMNNNFKMVKYLLNKGADYNKVIGKIRNTVYYNSFLRMVLN